MNDFEPGLKAARSLPAQSSSRLSFLWVSIVTLTFAAGGAFGQTVSNVRANLAPNGYSAVVTYDLTSTQTQTYNVSLYYSLDNAQTFEAAPDSVVGAVGLGISKGLSKVITWNGFALELRPKGGQQVIFRVAAQSSAVDYVIQFNDLMSSATEGQGTALLQLAASRPYTGKVKYLISAMSNVTSGSAAADIDKLSGETLMIAGKATIPVVIHDDFVIEKPKALTVDLTYDDKLGYVVGPTFRQMMILYDNDGYWNGVMMGTRQAEGEVPFRIKLLRANGAFQGTLVSSGSGAATGLSTFPVGDWPMDVAWDGTHFAAATMTNMSVPGTALFPKAAELTRRLSLLADTSTTNAIVQLDKLIAGSFHDQTSGGADSSYLNGETSGGFVLIKEVPTFVAPPVPKFPIPPNLGNSAAQISTGDAALTLKGDIAK